ncbi:leucyl aminopeptidase family protein [Croceicoccus sp. F390]|uniref:Leucyl aminopeptidase family protein n=1 Tax=Croceicoccus esteveae TaxID=3075597 RepID=A0ABU2ZH35_9SPHN|nr:leucyl aminopeptidase family protein [Croceicoccus sp. F390]MDT0575671.1 leucyl aminopeptidase family protein [Croceicoccus sp. F390]
MTEKTRLIQKDHGQQALAIHLVNAACLHDWANTLTAVQREILAAQKFEGKPNQTAILAHEDGWLAVGGVADPADLSSWCLARLAEVLPAGTYRLADRLPGAALFGWQCAQYVFALYKQDEKGQGPRILLTDDDDDLVNGLIAEAQATNFVRDLVNTPAQDMGPEALEAAARKIAQEAGADMRVTKGDALLREHPMVHAVGRAAAAGFAPRMLEIEWGDADAPRLAVVGKGVSFDSGGLDIKNSAGMALMKKDMGGAAHALALAALIMRHRLPVRLHCIVPAVENAISGNAFRPGDVLTSRAGKTVEITNTDAEGRLILADALALASEHRPDLIIDFATLTGAARVALGPDLPALMARRDETADAFLAAGRMHDDACWRLPLPGSYRDMLKSNIADLANSASGSFAGAITAGLFLDEFVAEDLDWVHLDTFAWRPSAKPGRPEGGAALGLRAAWRMLQQRYGR